MNSGMTKKERVLAALYKKETDRIPFSPLFSMIPLQTGVKSTICSLYFSASAW